MSTKTLRKRIALVAVAALGAGVLSVAPANAAPNEAPAAANASSAAGVLNIATLASSTGAPVASATASSNTSLGLIAVSDLAGTRVAGTTQTAVLLSTGAITVYTTAASSGANTISAITVDGGTIVSADGADTVNGTNTVAVNGGATVMGVSVRPNSSTGTFTIRSYHGNSDTYGGATNTAADATALATARTVPSLGTLTGQIVVTLAATSVSGVATAAASKIYYASSTGYVSLSADAASVSTLNQGSLGYANIQLNDAYAQDITSGTGLLQATATNGALVALHASQATKGTASTAFLTTNPANVSLSVAAPSAAPVSTVVTITYNGAVIGTKAFTFRGEISRITVSAPGIGALSATSADNAGIVFQDSAGNIIYPTSGSAVYPTGAVSIDPATATSTVSAISLTTVPTSTVAGYIAWTCGATAGNSPVAVAYVNPSGVIVKSNTFTASCADNAYSYTASFDKAVYAPGEIATLSVSVKDSKGNAANDYGTLGAATTYVGAPTQNVDTPAAGDKPTSGVKTYKFIVGTTEGSFAAVVNNTALNALSLQSAVTASYKVAAASGAVSNADVLKAIVSLIASINKQIAALQKALLRR